MSKRKTTEDLEQDLLIEYSSRFMHYYQENKAVVIGGGIAIVAAIGLIIGYFVYSAQQESEAQNLLGVAEQYFMNAEFDRALHGDDEDFTLGFVQIANNYGSTSAGNLAYYYAAVSEYELGNYESALSYIEDFSVPQGILGVAPISMHAIILLELERYEEAAEMFERAAEWDENESTTPYNLYEAAQAYMEAGMRDEAAELVENILENYESSSVAERAQKLQGQLAVQS